MRTSTAQLAQVLRGGSFQVALTVDVFYGATRRLQDVPVTDWSFSGDLDAEIPYSGDLTIVYQDDFAASYTPRQVTDALAPFGQRVLPYITITDGPFTERIPLGVYVIDDVPSASDQFVTRKGRRLVSGSIVRVSLLDPFSQIKRARFRSLQQPASVSAWAEVARVSRLPVTRTVTDAAVSTAVTYDRSRLATLRLLGETLGGRPVMLSDGTIGIVPDTAGTSVFALQIGEEGVLIDVGYALSSADRPNVVVGDFEDANGNPIHVESQITSGDLAVTSPYGENVIDFPDDKKQLYKTVDACQKAVDLYLATLSGGPKPRVPVTTLFDPRLELGDVGTLQRPDRILTSRIRKWAISGDSSGKADMTLTVEVLKDVPI